MLEWQGKVVLITGGSGGLGRQTAAKFLAHGATVCLADINAEGLRTAWEGFCAPEGRIETIVVDVSTADGCRRMVEEAAAFAGRIDVLVNGAGVWLEGPAAEMTEEMYDRIMDINLKGTYFSCTSAIPELTKTKGCIVNIGSDAGILASTTGKASLYSMSKAGVVMLTRALALELAARQVRVNAVCPGDVDTPMLAGQARDYGNGDPDGYLKKLLDGLPQKEHARFVRADEVAECIYFLSSKKVEAITGTCLSVDFGSTAGL